MSSSSFEQNKISNLNFSLPTLNGILIFCYEWCCKEYPNVGDG